MPIRRSVTTWEPPRFFDVRWLTARMREYAAYLQRVSRVGWRRACRRYPWLDTRGAPGTRSPIAETLLMLAAVWHGLLVPCVMLVLRAVSAVITVAVPLPLLAACAGAGAIFHLVTAANVGADYVWHVRAGGFYVTHVLGNAELRIAGTLTLAVCAVAGGLTLVAVLLTLLRLRGGLVLLRRVLWADLVLLIPLHIYGCMYCVALLDADVFLSTDKAKAAFEAFGWDMFRTWVALLAALVLAYMSSTLRAMRAPVFVTDRDRMEEPPCVSVMVDRGLEWFRANSAKRGLLKSSYYIMGALLVLILAPMFLGLGCVTPFEPPEGVENPAGPKVVTQIIKQTLIVNPMSSTIARPPDPDQIDNKMDPTAPHRVSSGGSAGDGDQDGTIGMMGAAGAMRFFWLRHSGPSWDDGMAEHEKAISNMLTRFKQHTKVKRVQMFNFSDDVIRGSQLMQFPEGKNPPFVYVTGTGAVGMSDADVRGLREYCLNQGGTIFADSAGSGFEQGFAQLMRRAFPEHEIKNISREDPLFTCVQDFSEGYPVLWEHTGRHIRGISSQGRWVVIWYPGELNDAWREGHMGLPPREAERAYGLGSNIMFYAFRNWAHHVLALRGVAVKDKKVRKGVPTDL